MYKAGVVSHLQRFQQSAESKELDRSRLNDLLGTFKNQIEKAEEKLMYIFGLYVGFDYGYMVAYSDDFGVSTIAETIDRFLALDSTGITQAMRTKLEIDLANEILDFQDDDMRQEFIELIETERELKSNEQNIEDQI